MDIDADECDDGNVRQNGVGESLEATAIRRETSACVREFIERLPDNYRAVMLLGDVEGFRNEEVAAILGLTVGTVKIRLHRAREKLRKELENGCRFDHDEGGALGCDPKPAAVPMTFSR